MATIITNDSDPLLWAALHSSYISEGKPRNVVRGGEMYEVFTTTTEQIAFKTVETLDYLDSRSITNSKPATYKELDG